MSNFDKVKDVVEPYVQNPDPDFAALAAELAELQSGYRQVEPANTGDIGADIYRDVEAGENGGVMEDVSTLVVVGIIDLDFYRKVADAYSALVSAKAAERWEPAQPGPSAVSTGETMKKIDYAKMIPKPDDGPPVPVQATRLINNSDPMLIVEGVDPEGRTVTFALDAGLNQEIAAFGIRRPRRIEVPVHRFISYVED